jgi:hypothetical protein
MREVFNINEGEEAPHVFGASPAPPTPPFMSEGRTSTLGPEVFDGGPSPAASEARPEARAPIHGEEGERTAFDGGGAIA